MTPLRAWLKRLNEAEIPDQKRRNVPRKVKIEKEKPRAA
jgi:hypothetical protein